MRIVVLFLLTAFLLFGEATKLYLKDGGYHLVREYQVQGDRVRFYSTDRDDWEEVPASLVDIDKTQAEVKARQEEEKENAAANAAEDKAERDAQKEVERVPQENGVYLIEEGKLTPAKAAEAKLVPPSTALSRRSPSRLRDRGRVARHLYLRFRTRHHDEDEP